MTTNAPLLSLLGFAAWTMVLVLAILSWRGLMMMTGGKKLDSFPGGIEHGSPAYWRLNRAHVNAVENLALFTVLVLAGLHLHVAGPLFQKAPLVVLGARVGQSLAHASSGSPRVIAVRFTFFAIQYVCFALMLVAIARAL
jgi:uncharacterized MAPEG superfamily protein